MSSLNKLDSTGEAMCEPALLNRPRTSNCCFSGLAERRKSLGGFLQRCMPPCITLSRSDCPYEQRSLHLLLHLHFPHLHNHGIQLVLIRAAPSAAACGGGG